MMDEIQEDVLLPMDAPSSKLRIRKPATPRARAAVVWQVPRAELVQLRGGVRHPAGRSIGFGSAGMSMLAHGVSLVLLMHTPFLAPASVGDEHLIDVTYWGYVPPPPPEPSNEIPLEEPPLEEPIVVEPPVEKITVPDEPAPPVFVNYCATPVLPDLPSAPQPEPPNLDIAPDPPAVVIQTTAATEKTCEDRLRAAIERHLRYPESARRRGEEGRLVIHLVVSADGRMEQMEVTPLDASVRLVRAVEQAVRRALPCEGIAAGSYALPITFRLTDARISRS
ncbi:MAG: TonB family protein [Kiritimatiellae bacterium]|nr:TonB family protein [Kiritimatiellia bacterium]